MERSREPVLSSEAEPGRGLRLDRIVRTAIGIADAEGLHALSMRRLATELDAGTMSLYRHVPGKDELVALMVDTVFGEIDYPVPGPPGWRAKLEFSARQEWAMYRRHLWVLPVVAMTHRPPLGANVLANVEWALDAVSGLGLDQSTGLQIYLTVSDYVQGAAFYLLNEAEAERHTGVTSTQWWTSNAPAMRDLLASGRFPNLARLDPGTPDGERVVEPIGGRDRAVFGNGFEFGLRCVLDGLQAYLADREDPDREPASKAIRLSDVTAIPGPTAAALELLGRRWIPELLYLLCRAEARFGELARAIPGVSRRVLAERLRLLADEGLVRRNVRTGPPHRISYALTERGASLRPAFDHIHAWAQSGQVSRAGDQSRSSSGGSASSASVSPSGSESAPSSSSSSRTARSAMPRE